MNPALTAFVLSIAVRIVTLVAGALIGANLLTKEQVDIIQEYATSQVAAWILALGTMLYGVAREYINRRKMLKAQAIPFPVSEKQLENRIAAGGAPSIWTPKDSLPGPSTTPRPAWSPQKE